MGAGNKIVSMVTPQKHSPFVSRFQDNRDYQTPQERKYSPFSHTTSNQQHIYPSNLVQSSGSFQPNVIVHTHHPHPQQFYGHSPVEVRVKPQPLPSYIEGNSGEPKKPSIISSNQKNIPNLEDPNKLYSFNYLPPVQQRPNHPEENIQYRQAEERA